MLFKWATSDNSTTCGKVYIFPAGKEILEYSIPSLGLTGIINGNQIVITSESIVTISSYVANFKTNGVSVSVNDVPQTSGVSSNDYNSPLKYVVTGTDGSTNEYTVQMVAPRVLGSGSLRLWFKADQLTLNDGDPVTSWSDVSGYGNHISQPTINIWPIYRKNQVNGYPAVAFRSALTSQMELPSGGVGLYVSDSGSFFFVKRLVSIGSAITLIRLCYTLGREIGISNVLGEYAVCRNATTCVSPSSIPLPMLQFISIGTVQTLTSNVREYRYGKFAGQSALDGTYSYAGGSNMDRVLLGNGNLDADIAELLYFNTNLSETDVEKVFFYLNTKYKLSP
ncbi:hypothetical protein EHQ24_15230 [Leptospira noumeaensis]|uniref:DUF5018 domain-containing protein n=1 Tax=Leptospira noumeaensis TaxID=2484964 RepID=A0A4R9IAL2_9LEPT|nr:hypothetical protein [Leptospira noumeaensis]TGK82589.1 hypothetical protein EHQ24_15230 [Leptospira noumeaensis]